MEVAFSWERVRVSWYERDGYCDKQTSFFDRSNIFDLCIWYGCEIVIFPFTPYVVISLDMTKLVTFQRLEKCWKLLFIYFCASNSKLKVIKSIHSYREHRWLFHKYLRDTRGRVLFEVFKRGVHKGEVQPLKKARLQIAIC